MRRKADANHQNDDILETECQPENDRLGKRMWAIEQAVTLVAADITGTAQPLNVDEMLTVIIAIATGLKLAINAKKSWLDEQPQVHRTPNLSVIGKED